jgi:glycosyltransferase involved in cell wall biosynthesis
MAHAVDKIVEAADLLSKHPHILICIVGEGAGKQKVEALVAAKRLTNVKIIGGVSKQEVRDFYALSDLNLVTLRDKPLFLSVIPSKIFEIMAMARPILSSVHGESRQILEAAGAATFVEAENPAQLAQAIVRLAGEPDRLAQMAQSGRSFVERHYSRDQLAAEFLRLLQAAAPAALPCRR